ncbi:MAG: TetR/AcrR family transcriptional regulator [Marmoricola sp.]
MTRLDRRSPNRGDERRAALLAALDALLKDGATLDDINIAQLSERAGVTRSAFYFYFENKSMAVMSLLETMYDEVAVATDQLLDTSIDPEKRIHAVISSLFDSVDHQRYAYRALLEARASSAAIREDWARGLTGFAEEVAAMITAERAAGTAIPGVDADALAAVLLDLNDRAVERYALGGGPDREQHIDALTSIWVRAIYGTGDGR